MDVIERWLWSDHAWEAVREAFHATGTPLDTNLGASILEHLRDAAPRDHRGAVAALAILNEAMGDVAGVDWPDDARTYIARAASALEGGQ